jgi:hypothetical protein
MPFSVPAPTPPQARAKEGSVRASGRNTSFRCRAGRSFPNGSLPDGAPPESKNDRRDAQAFRNLKARDQSGAFRSPGLDPANRALRDAGSTGEIGDTKSTRLAKALHAPAQSLLATLHATAMRYLPLGIRRTEGVGEPVQTEVPQSQAAVGGVAPISPYDRARRESDVALSRRPQPVLKLESCSSAHGAGRTANCLFWFLGQSAISYDGMVVRR